MARHMAANAARNRNHRTRHMVVTLVTIVGAGLLACLLLGCPALDKATPAHKDESLARQEPADEDKDTSMDEREDFRGQDDGATTRRDDTKNEGGFDLAAELAARHVKSIRLVGDSITAGFGTDGYDDTDLTGDGIVVFDDGAGTVHHESGHDALCWANEFRSYAAEHGVRTFVNAGVNGYMMVQLANDPEAWLGEGADVIVVALGTNDAGYFGPQEFEDASRTALEAARKKCRALVVVSPVSDLRPMTWLVMSPASQAEVLRGICEDQGYVFVDGHDAVSPDEFCSDGLHPNSEGSLALWACIRKTLGLS